ncbi:HEAT repeat domain-containing protein [Saccharopolyspora sp. 5N708]|uniref:HEAT repeat domain-containing protein n=1 Tax=Saccharopolyspora sp. 5N708 TaxID=3457424 RepID=UPI003FD0F69C
MRTVFIHGEVDRFEAARTELIDRFDRSRPELGAGWLVEYLLDDKFSRDGLLACWTEEDLARFLVEVVPRRLVVQQWSVVPEFLHQWLGFLAEEGLLISPNPESELHDAVERAVPNYLAAMAEPTEWSLEKFWDTTMRELVVDVDDPQAVIEFFDSVDSGEIDFDGDVVDEIERRDSLDTAPQPTLWLPPIDLDGTEPHRALAANSPIVHRMRTVLDWVGDGQDPSDVDKLVAALGSDAQEADLLLEWAERVGLLRSAGDLLAPTLIAESLLAEPELLWTRLWQRFVLVDDVFQEQFDILADGEDALPEIVQSALSLLYSRTDAVPLELIVTTACDLLGQGEPAEREAVRGIVRRMLAQWEAMQAVRCHVTTAPEEVAVLEADVPEGITADRTMVELMPAGLWAARGSLRAFGFQVPTVDDLASCPAELLALVAADTPADVQQVLIARWIDRLGAPQASAELAALLRRVDDPTIRLAALGLLEHTGAEGVSAVGQLIEDPTAGPAARMWLQSRPTNTENVTRPGDELLFSLDGMAAALDEDVDLFLTEFSRQQAADQLALIQEIATTEHRSAGEVLAVLAEHHPEETIATAAQAALNS